MGRALVRSAVGVLVVALVAGSAHSCPPPIKVEHNWTIESGDWTFGYFQCRGYASGDPVERYVHAGPWTWQVDEHRSLGGLAGGIGVLATLMASAGAFRVRQCDKRT